MVISENSKQSSKNNSSQVTSSQKAVKLLYLLSGVALLGLLISILLTQHFYEIRNGTAGFKSSCNISQTFNCDVVTASPHSELIAGLPLSGFAAGWFLALFLTSLFAYNRFWRREALRTCFALTAIATLIQLPYLWIMATQLKTYCIFCLCLDGLNLLALGCTLASKPEGFSVHRPNFSQWKVLASVIAASVLIGIFSLKGLLDQASFPDSEIAEVVKSILDSPPVSVQIGDEFPSIGPKNAPITIVEFSDFQCPYCRMAAFTLHSVAERYPHQIRIVFRNYPLDQSCNPKVPQSAHPIACEAAKVALCTQKQGKFKEVYEELFEQQASFAPGRPLEIAQAAGLDSAHLQGCAASPEVTSAIAKDIEEGSILGVKSTPTFFINGHRVEGAMPGPVWIQVIDQLLAHP